MNYNEFYKVLDMHNDYQSKDMGNSGIEKQIFHIDWFNEHNELKGMELVKATRELDLDKPFVIFLDNEYKSLTEKDVLTVFKWWLTDIEFPEYLLSLPEIYWHEEKEEPKDYVAKNEDMFMLVSDMVNCYDSLVDFINADLSVYNDTYYIMNW